jgi:hypothetical protein
MVTKRTIAMGVPERKEREFPLAERGDFDAALSLFDRDDWRVTIDDIAQKAEIGKGTVYLHFPEGSAVRPHHIDYTLRISSGCKGSTNLPVLERLQASHLIAKYLRAARNTASSTTAHDFQAACQKPRPGLRKWTKRFASAMLDLQRRSPPDCARRHCRCWSKACTRRSSAPCACCGAVAGIALRRPSTPTPSSKRCPISLSRACASRTARAWSVVNFAFPTP